MRQDKVKDKVLPRAPDRALSLLSQHQLERAACRPRRHLSATAAKAPRPHDAYRQSLRSGQLQPAFEERKADLHAGRGSSSSVRRCRELRRRDGVALWALYCLPQVTCFKHAATEVTRRAYKVPPHSVATQAPPGTHP